MTFQQIRNLAFIVSVAAGPLAMGCSAAPNGEETVATEGTSHESEALVGKTCGTRGASPCAKTEYCQYAPSAQCGTFDSGGVCATKPVMCTQIYKPVCGCDGTTYSNSCTAAAAGVSAASQGACTKGCGSDGWQIVISPNLAQVEGIWSRHNQVGVTVTDESIDLHADYTYTLTKTVGPGCTPQGQCAKFVTRIETSSGTFALNAGQGVQLVPSSPAADDIALSWILENPCGKTNSYRLTSTETGVDVYLTSAGQCMSDSDCKPGDGGPNTLFCVSGSQPAVECNIRKHTCQNTCEPICKSSQHLCMMCGALPPSGVCTSYACYPKTQSCPLVP